MSLRYARYAKTWQQALLSAAFIGAGALLIATGNLAGIVLAAFGALTIAPSARRYMRYRQRRPPEDAN